MVFRRLARLATGTALLLSIAPEAPAAEIQGTLVLLNADGSEVRQSASLLDAVVYFTAAKPVAVEPLVEQLEIASFKREFEPRVRAVPVGSTVIFPNRDPILHNAFSVSGKNRFDLGLYSMGEGEAVTFRHPGLVRVFCNVHPHMVAHVLVLETPFYTHPDSDGAFRLPDPPNGTGTLTVWHERTDPWSREIELPLVQPLEIRLEIAKPRVPWHLDKHGTRYRQDRRGKY